MASYHSHGNAASGSGVTILNLFGGTTVRPEIYAYTVSCKSSPADAMIEMITARTTALGTEDGGFTPVPNDTLSPAATADCGVGFTGGEPTYDSNKELDAYAVHQKNYYRWVAAPGGELIIPATANAGIGFKSVSVTSGTPTVIVSVYHKE